MFAIIISVVLLLIATNLGFTGFYGLSNVLDSELKERSSAAAEACVDTALLKFINNPGYSGGEDIDVDGVAGNDCTIDSVTSGEIKVQGYYDNKYFTNLKIEFDPDDMTISKWEECPSLSSC